MWQRKGKKKYLWVQMLTICTYDVEMVLDFNYQEFSHEGEKEIKGTKIIHLGSICFSLKSKCY